MANPRARVFHKLMFGRTVLAAAVAVGLVSTMLSGAVAQDDKPSVTVGSKDFTEQVIINEMLAQLLENADYEVERQLNLGGTAVVHQALVSGEIDTYIEYTGTALLVILEQEVPDVAASPEASPTAAGTPEAGGAVADAVYQAVQTSYQEEFDLAVLDPLGFNNTYTLALTRERATELGVETISDLLEHDDELVFGATQEFLTRPDGLPGLEELYGLDFSSDTGMDPGLVYQAVESGDVDVISAFATDGRIPAFDLVTLVDDMSYFPPYFASPVVRQELLDEDPAVEEILNSLSGLIDDETMAALNLRVDEGGEEAADVAQSFLEEQGLLG